MGLHRGSESNDEGWRIRFDSASQGWIPTCPVFGSLCLRLRHVRLYLKLRHVSCFFADLGHNSPSFDWSVHLPTDILFFHIKVERLYLGRRHSSLAHNYILKTTNTYQLRAKKLLLCGYRKTASLSLLHNSSADCSDQLKHFRDALLRRLSTPYAGGRPVPMNVSVLYESGLVIAQNRKKPKSGQINGRFGH